MLESPNNVSKQGMGNSFRYPFVKNYQYRTWFERVIEEIKECSFLPLQVGCQVPGQRCSVGLRVSLSYTSDSVY